MTTKQKLLNTIKFLETKQLSKNRNVETFFNEDDLIKYGKKLKYSKNQIAQAVRNNVKSTCLMWALKLNGINIRSSVIDKLILYVQQQGYSGIFYFNDDPQTTKKDVIRLLKKFINACDYN